MTLLLRALTCVTKIGNKMKTDPIIKTKLFRNSPYQPASKIQAIKFTPVETMFFCLLLVLIFSESPKQRKFDQQLFVSIHPIITLYMSVLVESELENEEIQNRYNYDEGKLNHIVTKSEGVEQTQLYYFSSNKWKKWVFQVHHK